LASVELITFEDRKNSLLNRHEISVIFKNAAGRIKRTDATEIIAKQHNVEKKAVIPISMVCGKGKTDVRGVFYVYTDEQAAIKQLPRYRLLRNLPKDERKKIIAEEKAAKLKAKQASTTQSKTRGQSGGRK
jgi:small subunit ribosomal protein S24e